MREPKVSIITPCWNGEKYLPHFLDSLVSQDYSNVELFFIDDGSTDNTPAVFEKWRPLLEEKGWDVHYIRQENQGAAAAVNTGLKLFSGEYLLWPDSDDLLLPQHISSKVHFMELHPHLGIAFCSIAHVPEGDFETFIKVQIPQKNANMFNNVLNDKMVMLPPVSPIIRGAAFLDVNPERDIYASRAGQNCQMQMPILFKYPYGVIDEVLAYYVIRKTSHSRSQKNKIKRRFALLDVWVKTINRLPCSAVQKTRFKCKVLLRHFKGCLTIIGESIICCKKVNGRKQITVFTLPIFSWKPHKK